MIRGWRVTGVILLVLIVVAAFVGYRLWWGKPFTINQLANRQELKFLENNPEIFTSLGLTDGTYLDHHSDKLAAATLQKRDDDYAQFESFLAEVRQFDRAKLDRKDQVTYDILVDQYTAWLAYEPFNWLSSEGLYPVGPMFGIEVQLPRFMQATHVVRNDRSAAHYVKRLMAMEAKLDGATAQMKWQSEQGVVLPAALIETTLRIINDTTAGKPEDNALVSTFKERMAKAQGLSDARRTELGSEAVAVVRDHVNPAYTRMAAALVALRPQATNQAAGVGRLPHGADYYVVQLRQMTTSNYTPEQVHQLGLSEVARITAEMDRLLNSQGITQGTVGERMAALGKDPRFLLPSTAVGRQELTERYQRVLDEVSALMPKYFHTVPKTHLRVQRVPEGQEKGSSHGYYQPATLDGSRPGTFFVNLRDLSEDPTWGIKTLAYHEGIPGHHFQISTSLGLKDLPLIRQQTLYSAYAEGWALYAEHFAAEMGLYKGDPFGDLGRLQGELMRSVRLVVDTGLHARGWPREQAIDYMGTTTGIAQSDVISEVERYMEMPGQACAYKVGELKILELREKAKHLLGDKFDIRDFHAVVLENGGVPLTLLEQLVYEWIAQAQSAKTS